MVQKRREKVAKPVLGLKEVRTTKVKQFQGHRKAAPKQKKVNPTDNKVSTAINKNIEALMASRVAHEGGHLSIIKAPANVNEYIKSGPKMSKLQIGLRAGQNAARKRKADEFNSRKKADIEQEIQRRQKEEIKKKRGPIIKIDAPELNLDDDVGGSFFDKEISELLGENKQEEETRPKFESIAAKMPARKAGFKGVHDLKAAAILEEGF